MKQISDTFPNDTTLQESMRGSWDSIHLIAEWTQYQRVCLIKKKIVYLFEAVVQQSELLVPPHHRRRHRILCESTLRLLVHEQELSTAAALLAVLIVRKPAFRVKVAFLVCVLPLVIIVLISSTSVDREPQLNITECYKRFPSARVFVFQQIACFVIETLNIKNTLQLDQQ